MRIVAILNTGIGDRRNTGTARAGQNGELFNRIGLPLQVGAGIRATDIDARRIQRSVDERETITVTKAGILYGW